MEELKLKVPTYWGACRAASPGLAEGPDFAEPTIPVLVHSADGLRIALGSHDKDSEHPDIQIERRPNGWAIFLHPLSGSDPSGVVYFLDDGRSFLVPKHGFGPTERIALVDSVANADVLEVDWPKPELLPREDTADRRFME